MQRKNAFKPMQGFAIVEVAIVTPVLLVMVFAIIECGLMLYDKAILTSASFQLVQVGVAQTTGDSFLSTIPTVTSSSTDGQLVTAAVQSGFQSLFVTPPATFNLVSLGPVGPNNPSLVTPLGFTQDTNGNLLTVTLSFSYQSMVLIPLIKLIAPSIPLPNPVAISSSTTMYLN
jgi:Flp pilus assembly protein TadG